MCGSPNNNPIEQPVTLAPGEHPRPAVGHQTAVYEVPEGAGDCGGWPATGHTAAHAQNPPLFYQDELPQRGPFFKDLNYQV